VIHFIEFIEKTWFLWWIGATVVILRWFHLVSSETGDSTIEVPASSEKASLCSFSPDSCWDR
jgi:hypothetical protein